MRLIGCHIENFGRLHDLTVDFEPDFHLISEPNGWGKSTLAAFIRVMFFGFEGENKRSGTENERKRFEPWQGGAYGGQITFETDGRTYTAARIFGDKKANDGFDLRDAQTNLKSDDFTDNLGEEIFRINGESFARTVLIGQNDCATATTDSINAKISNLTDNMNDLDCYEKASGALKDVRNKLTPRRKTGLLSQINDEITGLQTEIRQNASLEDAIRDCGERESRARDELQENRLKLERVFALSEQVSRVQDGKAKRKEYDRLCNDCTQTEKECREAEDLFPNEVPTEEELQDCMTACAEMSRAAEGMRNYALSDREREQLRQLDYEVKKETEGTAEREVFSDERAGEVSDPDTDMPERLDGKRERRQEPEEEKKAPQEVRFPRAWLTFMICGIIVVVIGLVIYVGFIASLPWLILALAGVALIAVGRYLRARSGKKIFAESAAMGQLRQDLTVERAARREAEVREDDARREAEARERDRMNALTRERMAWRNTLAEKEQNYLAAREQYEEKRTYVQEEIRRMGLTPGEELDTQITSIWRQLIDLENTRKDAQAARQRKKEFEDSSDMSFLLDEDSAGISDDLPSMEELHGVQRQLEEEADRIRDRADAYGKRLTDLREKYDEVAEATERLTLAEEERERVKKQFDQTGLALECLTAAKEAMTAKYMEPLLSSFSEYYDIVTGEPGGEESTDGSEHIAASQYRLDANTKLTVEEYGMQRETEYLSRGYQDMIGLCLRLALADAMYPEEKPFLILDDPFVNLDESNRAGGKRLMEAVTQRYQVLYFTCREG